MSSTTMTNHSRRQILTPSTSNKRNDSDGVIVDGLKKPSAITTKNLARPSMRRAPVPAPAPEKTKLLQPEASSNNHLLAGYLAHEFLTKGTLFGEPWDLARAEASSSRGEKRKGSESSRGPEKEIEKQQRYAEVADLLKGETTHLPGIINPAQLSRFLHGAGGHVEL